MLVFDYYVLNDNLSEIFGEVTWKYKIDELINKLQNTLNELINRNDLDVKTTKLSKELLETTKIIENCTSCKDKKIDGIDIGKIKNCLAELEKEEQGREKWRIIDELNDK